MPTRALLPQLHIRTGCIAAVLIFLQAIASVDCWSCNLVLTAIGVRNVSGQAELLTPYGNLSCAPETPEEDTTGQLEVNLDASLRPFLQHEGKFLAP